MKNVYLYFCICISRNCTINKLLNVIVAGIVTREGHIVGGSRVARPNKCLYLMETTLICNRLGVKIFVLSVLRIYKRTVAKILYNVLIPYVLELLFEVTKWRILYDINTVWYINTMRI